MGNTKKYLFWPICFPNPNCKIYHLNEKDTWLHVLLKCNNPIIYGLKVKRHKQVLWELCKLLLSIPSTRCYTLMNAGKSMNSPAENTIPSWLLQCLYNTQRCQCTTKFKPHLLRVQGISYKHPLPIEPNLNIKPQFIEFSYTNNRFSLERIQQKTNNYMPLLQEICNKGWNVPSIAIITTGAKGTTHIYSLKLLHLQFNLSQTQIKKLSQINVISIQFLTSIILHKRKIEHHQLLPITYDPP